MKQTVMCQSRRILAIVCGFAKQSHECDLAVARKRTRKNREIETTRRVTLCLVLRVQAHISGGDSKEVPPVPMPNTEVKLLNVDDTWWVTARESRKLPEPKTTRR